MVKVETYLGIRTMDTISITSEVISGPSLKISGYAENAETLGNV